MVPYKVIAIDGPAAAGKSTIAQMIAKQLGYVYVDTGAMYRAVTLKALNKKINLEDETQINNMLQETKIQLTNTQRVLLDDVDVTEAIRQPQISQNVSVVSAHKSLRDIMKARQIKYAETNNVVMDGRDIGTYVLPNADFKFFMTASVEVRANRRYQENLKRNVKCDLETLKQEIQLRDELDSTREYAPLIKAEDAIIVDTSSMTINEVVDKIIKIVKGGVH